MPARRNLRPGPPTSGRGGADAPRETGSALAKSLAVLELMANSPNGLTGAQVTDGTGMPKQTAHRVLQQLAELGLIAQTPTGDRYTCAARLRQLSRAVLMGSSVQQPELHRLLTELVAVLGETCNVGVLDDQQVLYVDRVECDWPLRLQLQAGSRVPVHCTAIGKLLLAHLPPDQLDRVLSTLPLTAKTPHTLSTPSRLREALHQVRAQGYAINEEEDYLGLSALAVPVHDASGTVVAGLAVHAPIARFPLQRMLKQRPLMMDVARQIGQVLFPAQPA